MWSVGLVINCDIILSEKAELAECSECDHDFPVHWVKSVRNLDSCPRILLILSHLGDVIITKEFSITSRLCAFLGRRERKKLPPFFPFSPQSQINLRRRRTITPSYLFVSLITSTYAFLDSYLRHFFHVSLSCLRRLFPPLREISQVGVPWRKMTVQCRSITSYTLTLILMKSHKWGGKEG